MPEINRFDINTKKGRKRKNTVSETALHKLSLVLKGFFCLMFMFLGILLMVSGIASVELPELDYYIAELINEIVSAGITVLIYYFYLKAKFKNKYLRFTIAIFLLVFLIWFTDLLGNYFVLGVQLLTGFFGIVTSIVLLLNVIRQIRDRVWFLRSLLWGFIYFISGLDLILGFAPNVDFIVIFGFYIFSFALNIFWESFKSFFSFSKNKREVRRKTITLPTFISAFLPIGFFRNLNSTIDREEYDENLFIEDETEEEEKTDLTIYIHTRAGLMPGFGHVDISFDDKVYCYGNYDQDTWLFGGFLSDGVLATTTPENHIKNALTNDKKVLVAYDLKISEKTKKKIQKQIDKMMQKSYRWYPKAEQAARGEIQGKPEDYNDVASLMYLNENTELYKFDKGSPYKTYYLLGQNCAMVANEIVGHSGIKLLRLNRIVTPGSYLEYLDQLYKMKHTIVVNRSIYMLNDNGKPYLLTPEKEQQLSEQMTK